MARIASFLSGFPLRKKARWRVPLIYQKDRWFRLSLLDQIQGLDLGNLHWRWRSLSRPPFCGWSGDGGFVDAFRNTVVSKTGLAVCVVVG